MRLILLIACTLALCAGLWNHDWLTIGASVLLATGFILMGEATEDIRHP